ncbi:MAG: UvrD-helicase domain-containing protein [Bdellovibrionales bacterium]|nr:UvrD-helicase domain-containing protein [Bdellovibrionales bacterium]
MNQQQLEIIEGFGQGQAVIAGAGCGKTTTLVAKCIQLLKNKPDARFCAVSFTEKSVRDLKQSLAEGFQKAKAAGELKDGGIDGYSQHDHWVKTIHGLGFSIVQEFPEAAGLAGGERILLEDESERLWRRSVNQLWTQNDNLEITEAIGSLLRVYSKSSLETLLSKLRSLEAFGVEEFVRKQTSQSLQELWSVYESVALRFKRYKQRAGALDFNDLEIFAARALEDKRVAQYYQKRFDLVLVDEFQDTNPVQGKILEKFVKPGMSNLCIVGDPKQSIYRFRDADVTVFQDLTERLARKHLLTTNYRSRPAIIHFVNDVCDPLFRASEMDYEPLIAGRDETDPNASRVFQLNVSNEENLARFLRSEAAAGRDLSEYVVLARSVKKEQTQMYLSAFEAAGVPFVFGSGGRFFSDPRVVELVAFLKGWLSKNNSLSQVAALRAPWIGVTDAELMAWKQSGAGFFDSFFLHSKHPVALALSGPYLDRTPLRPGQILEVLWGHPEMTEEMLLPIATLWQKCENLSAQGARFHEVVSQLHSWVENEKIESDIPPPDQAGAVRIMTVHASKGLQFPRVILLDFEKAARADNRKDLLWNRRVGVHLFARDEDGNRDKTDPSYTTWSEMEKRADVSESKRVFYVALTRAQEALYFVWKQKEKEDYKDREVDLVRDYWRAWVAHLGQKHLKVVDCAAIQVSDGAVLIPKASGGQVSRLKLKVELDPYRPRHSPSEWLILHQCPLRYYYQYGTDIQAGTRDDEDGPRGGSDPIEQLDFTDLERGTDFFTSQGTQSAVAKKGEKVHLLIEEERWPELAQEFASPELGLEIVVRLRAALDAEKGQEFKEVGFEVPFSRDEALVGVMDRLVLSSDGKTIHVTDYKWTGSPRSPKKLLEHYLLQLKLYAWAALKMTEATKVTARLIHFTANSIEIIEAPADAFERVDLEKITADHFKLAVKLLFNQSKAPIDLAQPGDHCRYCPHQVDCPKSAVQLKKS